MLAVSRGPGICVGQDFALTEMAYCFGSPEQRYEKVEYRGDWEAQSLWADIIGAPALVACRLGPLSQGHDDE
ncbi:Cytochrome P450 52A13 [Tolypocladium capitatum]|uniref:Cytochrome P450 52A13 n=1 Tax=Tolypocladium capitatum TaxID=45235 RepID=A0A2K3QKY7_9HYPO|nr:Cytochrome P450 52A13 [Tolypocladium capitatum]